MILKENKNILCNLYINYNLKNILISLTEKNGKLIKQWSTKSLKKSKFKKNISYNIYLIITNINNFLNLKKIKRLNIFFKGNGIRKVNILKNLKKKKIKIFYIFNKLSLPFNGCKKKKKKRL